MITNYTRIIEHIGGDVKRYVIQGVSCFICHRTDGPAIISESGEIYWCVNGKFVLSTEVYCNMCEYTPEETVMMLLKHGNHLPHEL